MELLKTVTSTDMSPVSLREETSEMAKNSKRRVVTGLVYLLEVKRKERKMQLSPPQQVKIDFIFC